MFFNKKKKMLSAFLDAASLIGLREEDAQNASAMIEDNDLEVAFDIILAQLYEYDVEITREFYAAALAAGKKLNVEMDQYKFIRELIREEIPKPVLDKLAGLLADILKKT